MSYILDALKKAERERGLTKVPNIETVHDIKLKRKNIGLIVAEIGVICLVAAAWIYFRASSGRIELKVPASTVLHQGSLTEDSEPPTENGKSIDQSSNPPPASAGVALDIPIPKTLNTPITSNPEIQPRTAAAKPDSSVPNIKTELPVAAITAATVQKSPPGNDYVGLPATDTAMSAAAGRESSRLPENSPSLREIASSMKMNISFHVYSDNPERRLVLINGKRYKEGDSLEQDCVLEGITPEGLILRRGEETVIFRVDGGF